jgi:hypothetical protein
MLDFLRGKASERKLRLFAAACVRRAWHLLTDTGRQAVEAAEAYADAMIGREPLQAARHAAYEPIADAIAAANMTWTLGTPLSPPESAADAALGACDDMGSDSGRYYATLHAAERSRAALGWTRGECFAQVALVHDVLGNPFRYPPPLPAAVMTWNDRLVVRLAQAIYDGRRWGDMPILGDALLDAGCDVEDVVAHCRAGGEHVRGCWVVDLCLGKS